MSIESLRIHEQALQLARCITSLVRSWSQFDRETLGKQIVRSADSIASNIAEGYGRTSTGQRIQFLLFADASCQEAKSQVRLAADRDLIEPSACKDLVHELRRLSISPVHTEQPLPRGAPGS
jgi:four helix bundle protein